MYSPLSVQFVFIFMQFSAKIMLNNRLVPLELAPLWEILDPALYANLTLYLNPDKLKEIVLCVRITYAYAMEYGIL